MYLTTDTSSVSRWAKPSKGTAWNSGKRANIPLSKGLKERGLQPMRLLFVSWFVVISFFVCLPAEAAPNTQATPDLVDRQLGYVDANSGLVASLVPAQLPTILRLITRTAPSSASTLNLATMALRMALQWDPLTPKAWQRKGFSPNQAILLQVSATNPVGRSAWNQIRLIVPVGNPTQLKATLSALPWQNKRLVTPQSTQQLASRFSLSAVEAKVFMRELVSFGTFLIADAGPLDGVVILSLKKEFVLVDILSPVKNPLRLSHAPHRQRLLQVLSKRGKVLNGKMPGADSLRGNALGIWLRPKYVGIILKTMPSPVRCLTVEPLVTQSDFQAVSMAFSVSANSKTAIPSLHLRGKWSLRTTPKWEEGLHSSATSLLRLPNAVLQVDLNTDKLGVFRKTTQSRESWVSFWGATRLCAAPYRTLAMLVAWPQILGMFERDIAALSPNAQTFIDSVATSSLTIAKPALDSTPALLIAETWLPTATATIVKQWLHTVFGSQIRSRSQTTWGKGPIKPYAIETPNGSIIGAGFSPNARKFALQSHARSAQHTTPPLISVRVRPRQLAQAMKTSPLPLQSLWKHWQHVSATLVREGPALRFSIEAK